MGFSPCVCDVGSLTKWLAADALDHNANACAVPTSPLCGTNSNILASCCQTIMDHDNSSSTTSGTTSISSLYGVYSLLSSASNETYRMCQDRALNHPGEDGGLRCNDLEIHEISSICNSLTNSVEPFVNTAVGQQICVTGAAADPSTIMQNCCGGAAVSQNALTAQNISSDNIACRNGTGGGNSADPVTNASMASTMGLVAAIVWAVGLL